MIKTLNQLPITPEQEIVLHAIRVDGSKEARLKQLMGGKVDWEATRQFALKHGVMPLLYAKLKDLGESLVPADEMAKIHRLYLVNGGRNTRLTEIMGRVSELLCAKGIEHMPFKGPMLAKRLYGDTSMRQITDVDVLIRESDYRGCGEVLTENGLINKVPVAREDEKWLLRGDNERLYYYENDMLDIHWAITKKSILYPLKEEHFWREVGKIKVQGREYNCLSPENLCLIVCIHGAKHMWGKLTWIADLVYFTKKYPDFDWAGFLEWAAGVGFERVLMVGLMLAEELGGASLPEEVRGSIREEAAIERLAKQAIDYLLDNTSSAFDTKIRYYLRCRERRRDRYYYYLFRTFMPEQVDWERIPLPRFLYPLYYLLRPARLLIVFGPRVVRSFFRK